MNVRNKPSTPLKTAAIGVLLMSLPQKDASQTSRGVYHRERLGWGGCRQPKSPSSPLTAAVQSFSAMIRCL